MLSPNTPLRPTLAPSPRLRMHIIHDSLRRLPLGALPRLHMQHVHGVDFLEGTALGLIDEEVRDEDAREAAARENVAVGVVDGARDEGREEGDEEVPSPVGGGCDTDGDGTVAGWVEFTADSPDHRSPGGSVAFRLR